jgi:hypothetical protein
MNVVQVDPRDTQWEAENPKYRVHFWQHQGASTSAWVSDEWEIAEADVDEVLHWSRAESAGRSFVVYVLCAVGTELGLLRLYGTDPSVSP